MRSVADVLQAVKSGKLSLNKAENLLKLDAIAIVGKVARLDSNRYLRRGVPEIVYAQGKNPQQLFSIVSKLVSRSSDDLPIILSRVKHDQIKTIELAVRRSGKQRTKFVMKHYTNSNLVAIVKNKSSSLKSNGRVALLAAGTSDMPALNEAEVLLNLFGCRTIRFNDVGVSALHRLVKPLERIVNFDPDAIIVAAGMEGALPSVIAGLSSVPVIGLPTSVGYGYGENGEAALMNMLQACPLGISVVNIDAGIAAGVVAWLISKRKQNTKSLNARHDPRQADL
ncbi:MAG: nickel pincer cofactor biosynthesis protein LarB [Rhabdochlamydiaceae bacterium]